METILVVEDEYSVRTGIVDLLSNSGYFVLSAPNGRDAIDLLDTKIPDLIISDIMMPEIDGYELLDLINRKSRINIPFIYLTAKAEYTDLRTGMEKGADDYITKPFRAKDLLSAVKTRLEKSKKQLEKLEEVTLNISSYIPHELRTPLVSIIGFTQMMINDLNTFKEDEIIEMLGFIEGSGLRLYDRIEKFISYSTVATKTDISYLIADEWTPLSSFFHGSVSQKYEKQLNRLDISFEDAFSNLQKEYLKFIINELVENALKFSVDDHCIIVKGYVKDNCYNISVQNKSKIDFPIQSRFQLTPFIQFNREQIQQIGNGLGLVTINKIIDLCEGDLIFSKDDDLNINIKAIIPVKIKIPEDKFITKGN